MRSSTEDAIGAILLGVVTMSTYTAAVCATAGVPFDFSLFFKLMGAYCFFAIATNILERLMQ